MIPSNSRSAANLLPTKGSTNVVETFKSMFYPRSTPQALLPKLGEGQDSRAKLPLPLSFHLRRLSQAIPSALLGLLSLVLVAFLVLTAVEDGFKPRKWAGLMFGIVAVGYESWKRFPRAPWVAHLERGNLVVDRFEFLILNPAGAALEQVLGKTRLVASEDVLFEEDKNMPVAALEAAAIDNRSIKKRSLVPRKVYRPSLTVLTQIKAIALGALVTAVVSLILMGANDPPALALPLGLAGGVAVAVALHAIKRRSRPFCVEIEADGWTFWDGDVNFCELDATHIAFLSTTLPLGSSEVSVNYDDETGVRLRPEAAHPDILRALIDHPKFMAETVLEEDRYHKQYPPGES